MNISERELAIIKSVFLEAKKPASVVASEIGMKPHTVRRTLGLLRSQGKISTYPFINVYAMGLVHYGVYFSVGSISRTKYNQLLTFLSESEQVSFLAELAGSYKVGITICAASLSEVLSFLGELTTKFGEVITEKSVAVRTRLSRFPLKIGPSRKVKHVRYLQWGVSDTLTSIDMIDHDILSALANRPALSNAETARALGLKPMTFDYRVRKLEERGIVTGYATYLNAAAAGFVAFYVLIFSRGPHQAFQKAIFRFAETNSSVAFMIENLGSWDFEMGIIVKNPTDVSSFLQELHEACGPHIMDTKVLHVLSYRKVTNYPFKKSSPAIKC